MRRILVALSALLLIALFIILQRAERSLGEVQVALLDYVIDGDSLAVNIEGQVHIFRLMDIDAPEQDEPFHQEATTFVKEKLQRDLPVYYYQGSFGQDIYGRSLVLVWQTRPDRVDRNSYLHSLNAQLVQQGLAIPIKYKVYSPFFDQLEPLRVEAQQKKRGVHQ